MACFNLLPLIIQSLRGNDGAPKNGDEDSEESENLINTEEVKDLIQEHLTKYESILEDVNNEIETSTIELERLVKPSKDSNRDDIMRTLKKMVRLSDKKNMVLTIITKLDSLSNKMDTQKIHHEFSEFSQKLQCKLKLNPDQIKKKMDKNDSTTDQINETLSEIDTMVHSSTEIQMNNEIEESKCDELFQHIFGRRIEDRAQQTKFVPISTKQIIDVKIPKENWQSSDGGNRKKTKVPI